MSAGAEAPRAVSPNAQTIKDGSYPLAETLVLYVSPKASPTMTAFVEYLTSGKADSFCRKHGFMPVLRSVQPTLDGMVKRLYGPDIERVRATADAADDLALAGQMIDSAREMRRNAKLLTSLCCTAYELAAPHAEGELVAMDAVVVLEENVPSQRFDCALKRVAICEAAYAATGQKDDAEILIETCMKAGEVGTGLRRFPEAHDVWQKAQKTARATESPKAADIENRMSAFAARSASAKKAEALATALKKDPQDRRARRQMLDVQLLELAAPAEAIHYLDVAGDEVVKVNLPLAAEPVESLSAAAALKVAEWYVDLTHGAGGGRQGAAGRPRQGVLQAILRTARRPGRRPGHAGVARHPEGRRNGPACQHRGRRDRYHDRRGPVREGIVAEGRRGPVQCETWCVVREPKASQSTARRTGRGEARDDEPSLARHRGRKAPDRPWPHREIAEAQTHRPAGHPGGEGPHTTVRPQEPA